MDRQHGIPLLLHSGSSSAEPLRPIGPLGGGDAASEAYIQALIHDYPACLPIPEIDSIFSDPVPICTELNTPAGPIDNFMVTLSGLPVLVECKLWRNPEARREVVSQILDYAKELSRWSSSDLQREVSRRLKRDGNPLLDMVQAIDPRDRRNAVQRCVNRQSPARAFPSSDCRRRHSRGRGSNSRIPAIARGASFLLRACRAPYLCPSKRRPLDRAARARANYSGSPHCREGARWILDRRG